MKLEDIGFYTLSDERAKNTSHTSPLQRCELILTDACNFKCPYCRGVRPDIRGKIPFSRAVQTLTLWLRHQLKNVRFSGGEPTLYPGLESLIHMCDEGGVERIAISTNGSASLEKYKTLLYLGVNDISISLDACCSSFGDKMCGVPGMWEKVVRNIEDLSKLTYVTVGVVFTDETIDTIKDVIEFADGLGVSDIRVIPAAQFDKVNSVLKEVDAKIINKYPILKYRMENFHGGKSVRGMKKTDHNRCPLVLDDMAVAQGMHFPCIIYLREGGDPIGVFTDGLTRIERKRWAMTHDTYKDKICRENCLDVCIDYNNKVRELQKGEV